MSLERHGFRRFVASVGLGTLLSLAPVLAAAPPPPPPEAPDGPPEYDEHEGTHGRFHERFIERLTEKLDLTAEQSQAVDAAFQAQRQNWETNRPRMKAARETLEQRVHAETLDEKAIREAASAVAALQAERALDRARLHQTLRGILTPEQMERLRELHEERREGPHGHHGPPGMHPRGPRPT